MAGVGWGWCCCCCCLGVCVCKSILFGGVNVYCWGGGVVNLYCLGEGESILFGGLECIRV